MKLLNDYQTRGVAEEDRAHNNYQRENRLVAHLGLPPLVITEPPPTAVIQVEQERVHELTLKVETLGNARASQPSLALLLPGIVLVALGELFGFILLLADLGVQNPQRPVLAFLLGGTAVFLTYRASAQTTPPTTRRVRYVLGWSSFAAFATIVGLVRLSTMAEGTWSAELPMALLMIALTITPPLLLEHLLRHTFPGLQVAREYRHVRVQLRAKQREHTKVQLQLHRDRRKLHEYEEQAARFRALYDATYYNSAGPNDSSNAITAIR